MVSRLKFLFLPDGEDPDSMVRNLGTEKFKADTKVRQPYQIFYLNTRLKLILKPVKSKGNLAN